jgi:hypothetical protein
MKATAMMMTVMVMAMLVMMRGMQKQVLKLFH